MKRKQFSFNDYMPRKRTKANFSSLPYELRDKIAGYYKAGVKSRAPGVAAKLAARSAARAATSSGMASFGPVLGTIGTVASLGYDAYKAIEGRRKYHEGVNRKKSGFAGSSMARYQGKFAKPKKSIDKYTGLKNAYQSKGYVVNKEIYGKINSPDCVYLGHGTFDIEQVARAITSAILRKLLKKGGYNVTNGAEALPFQDTYADARGFRVSYQVATTGGTQSQSTYDLGPAETLDTLCTNSGLYDYIFQSMVLQDGILGASRGYIENVSLFQADAYATGTSYRLKTNLNMKNEIIKLFCKTTLNIQNRTKGAETASSDAQTIDNQPLKGILYRFVGASPQSKQNDNWALSRNNYRGVFLKRAAELVPGETFKEPPLAKQFNNCYASVNVTLQPGDVKKSTLFSSWSGYFNNIVGGKLQVRSNYVGGTTGGIVEFGPGKMEMFALEEQINTGSSNLITVSYESELDVGCHLITGKAPVCLAKHEEAELSNVTV